jgi:hypothetical protein
VLELGLIAFVAPWMFLALVLLPLLWWLLRVTPPAPRLVRFPAVRLLFGLTSTEQTPASSPLWLILLRLATAAALILALAHPLINPGRQIVGTGPLLMVVDDGWAGAARWSARQAAMLQTIAQAEREERGVIFLPTARDAEGRPPAPGGVLGPADARGMVRALAPKPWPTDRDAASKALAKLPASAGAPVRWFSDGLDAGAAGTLAAALLDRGPVQLFRDPPGRSPRILLPPDVSEPKLSLSLRRPGTDESETVVIRGLSEDGRALQQATAVFADGKSETTVQLDLPVELRNQLTRIEISGQTHAAAAVLMDERWRRRPVGLATDKPTDRGAVLLSETYYVERALTPFTDLRRGRVEDLVKARKAVIVVPDGYTMSPGDRTALQAWIEAGGLALRFGGPNLTRNQDDDLTPVRLRRGGRVLGGALLWSKPARLAPFADESPFSRLTVPGDVTISRQVLAEPSLDLGEKTWARLTDGTPLVTAERRGKGRLVLVHTTANADWTNLPLSGLFVDMLRRIVATSRGVADGEAGNAPLPPHMVLDGFGRPAGDIGPALPIAAGAFAKTTVQPRHPPGYYGGADTRRALNLSPQLGPLRPIADLPAGVQDTIYSDATERDLKPWLLLLALLLLLTDVIATLALRGLLPRFTRLRNLRLPRRGATAAGVLLIIAVAAAADARAQSATTQDRFALEASQSTRLAFVITGNDEIDSISEAGLIGLTSVLRQRTAVEPGAPIGVDPVRHELAFFPLLYWPVTGQAPPDAATMAKLNRYLENGGTILFDTRNQSGGAFGEGGDLRRVARGLNIPPLEPVPPGHILTKAFYLMQDFPGRWTGGRLWVERGDSRRNDGVSRIIAGSHDWAAAWALDQSGRPMFPVVPGGERQREMAYRFGVNLVMYTLTGNYKSDQVHVPAILERLGQ